MDYCGNGGSGRRRAFMDHFQQFLENIDESRAICPEGPCPPRNGACTNVDRMGFDPPRGGGFNSPRMPDYSDPNRRPLITSIQVQEIRPTSDWEIYKNDPLPPHVTLVEQEDLAKNTVCPAMDSVCPAGMMSGTQGLPNGASNCPSQFPQRVTIMDETDYSLPEPIDWGECQLPAHELERQHREKYEKEKLARDIEERDRRARIRREERRKALRPHGPPPPNTEHRAEVDCVQCYPKKPHIPPTYPPLDDDKPTGLNQLCPIVDTSCPTAFGQQGNGYEGAGGYGCGGYGGGGMGLNGFGGGFDSAQCPAGGYMASKGMGGGGGGPSMSPCMTAILERERKERERQEREIRDRMERERIEQERKRLEKAEKDLKARKPYMCPGQAKMEEDSLKKAKKDFLKGKPINLDARNGRNGNGNGGLRSMTNEERFGQCVPAGELAPCDPKACPGTQDASYPLVEVKSRELVGGVLFTGCDCTKRNGLQHDCKRTLCRGRPECLTKPDPMCIPSGGPGYISPCYPVCQPPCW